MLPESLAHYWSGSAAGLLITDPAIPDVRMTQDVDMIVEAATWLEYHRLEQVLIEKGFDRDTSEGAPLCRWLVDGVIVDVMPVSEEILGFSNRCMGRLCKTQEQEKLPLI